MTINRRTVLTGAALAPFVPGVAVAGESEPEGTLYFLPPEQWFCQVSDDGVVTIGAHVYRHADGSQHYRHVIFHPDDKMKLRHLDGTVTYDSSLYACHTRYENEKFAGMTEDVNHDSYMIGREYYMAHPPKGAA